MLFSQVPCFPIFSVERMLNGAQERVATPSTVSMIVIHVNGPDEHASKSSLHHVVHLWTVIISYDVQVMCQLVILMNTLLQHVLSRQDDESAAIPPRFVTQQLYLLTLGISTIFIGRQCRVIKLFSTSGVQVIELGKLEIALFSVHSSFKNFMNP